MKRFRGGISVTDTHKLKEEATAEDVRRVIPAQVYLSLRMQRQMLAPCVTQGQAIRVGDVVATDPNERIPPLHSGISGRVTAVDIFHPAHDGGEAPTVILENDYRQTAAPFLPTLTDNAAPDEIVRRMYEAGLVGMGGGGYPTHLKYRGLAAQYLLINGCECEPYLAADAALAQRQTALVTEGALWLAKAAGVSRDHIRLCTESQKTATQLNETGLPVVTLPRRYPQGSERQLVESVLGKRLADGVLPTQAGIAVSNLATAVAMGEAARGLPLTHRVVTVSGKVTHPLNALVPLGTPFADVVSLVTPAFEGRARYIAGGPMTGRRLTSLQAGIPKTCGGVTVLPSVGVHETPCIRCGACARACPSALFPFLIESYAAYGDRAQCAALRTTACISCGCCSYVCPAKRPLAARVTAVKKELRV